MVLLYKLYNQTFDSFGFYFGQNKTLDDAALGVMNMFLAFSQFLVYFIKQKIN